MNKKALKFQVGQVGMVHRDNVYEVKEITEDEVAFYVHKEGESLSDANVQWFKLERSPHSGNEYVKVIDDNGTNCTMYGLPDDYEDDEFDDWDRYEEKDYGPSNPWDAPGMKISDFITGVQYF